MARKALKQWEMLYLIEAVGCNVVKIGKTHDVYHRLATLRTGNHADLELRGVCLRADLEQRLHSMMGKFRLRGEWFTWNDDSRACFEKCCRMLGIMFESVNDIADRDLREVWKTLPMEEVS